jgi:hypothetical protein
LPDPSVSTSVGPNYPGYGSIREDRSIVFMQAPIARMRETFHRKASAEIIISAAGRWSA